MEQITSAANPKIKYAAKLAASRSARYAEGRFLLEGFKTALAALDAGAAPEQLFLTEGAMERFPQECGRLLASAGWAACISEAAAARLSDTATPQGVFAVCPLLDKQFSAGRINKSGHYLLLCSLQDPGNIGTILRTAHAFAIDGVILSRDCPDLFGPKLLRATMGSIFSENVFVAQDFSAAVVALQAAGLPVWAAALRPDARLAGRCSLRAPCAVMIGNEGRGLPPEQIAQCDGVLRIPMAGTAQSLNAAVAASVLMWEMVRLG